MLGWELVDGTIQATDSDGATVRLSGSDLAIEDAAAALPLTVDDTVVVTGTELAVPPARLRAMALGTDTVYEVAPSTDSLDLPTGEYVVEIEAPITTFLRFSGVARIEHSARDDSLALRFRDRTRVIVGFRGRHELPAATITVRDTVTDLATAIEHLHSSIKTTDVDRSRPGVRGHPPTIERGASLDVPRSVTDATTFSGVELSVPPTYESLYVTAPLAYYLQARIRLDQRGPARLSVPVRGITHHLDAAGGLERAVERLLRKVFFFDCLVRSDGSFGSSLAEHDLLRVLDLDTSRLAEADPQERLERYLDVPLSAIEHRLPDWPLATYVEPDPERAEALPYLLDRLSLLFTPRTSELHGRELIERSLDDFYRSGTVATVDVVKPELQCGRVHGWLAAGVPIDVFKTTTTAYENRLRYLEGPTGSTTICVVCNDASMANEGDSVADIYRGRSETVPIDLSIEESLGTADLARVFESGYDVVHYIGHCEVDGFRCVDGTLPASSLSTCSAQTFFLNACGSFYEGETLVEKGAVAGAVTCNQVLNEQAVKVGSAFAKLLVHGFSIERALRLARRRIMMGKDYLVVGDGTHSITTSECQIPTAVTVDRVDADRYFLTFDCYSPREAGASYRPPVDEADTAYLCGTPAHFIVDEPTLRELLSESETCVIFDGDLYWSDRLYELLDTQ